MLLSWEKQIAVLNKLETGGKREIGIELKIEWNRFVIHSIVQACFSQRDFSLCILLLLVDKILGEIFKRYIKRHHPHWHLIFTENRQAIQWKLSANTCLQRSAAFYNQNVLFLLNIYNTTCIILYPKILHTYHVISSWNCHVLTVLNVHWRMTKFFFS